MRLALLLGCLVVTACGSSTEKPSSEAGGKDQAKPAYEVVAGETRGRITAEDGSVTSMTSGTSAPAMLPDGFSVAPGLEVLNSTSVTRGQGSYVMLTMEGAQPVADIVAFYRQQALAAGIAISINVATPQTTTIGGEGAGGRTFSLIATRTGDKSAVQLTISRGLK